MALSYLWAYRDLTIVFSGVQHRALPDDFPPMLVPMDLAFLRL
jgi:hypothetical protein